MLNDRSLKALQGVHPDLHKVVLRASELSPIPFIVTEGLRSLERQKQLVAAGASKTLNSRHLTGHAIDLAPLVDMDGDGKLEVRWDWPLFAKLAAAMDRAAAELGVTLEWGGRWRTFKDGPHWQLPRSIYK